MNKPTTVIVDFSVCVHQLNNALNVIGLEKEYRKAAVQANMAYLGSGRWVEQLIGHKEYNMIYTKDSKPYWRTEYLLQEDVYNGIAERAFATYKEKYPKGRKAYKPVAIHYKGGRKLPNSDFTTTKRRMLICAERNEFNMLGFHGYEADDLAAALVMTNRMLPVNDQREIVLATVDTDWMGLVDKNVTWMCSKGYEPRIRHTMEHINEWSLRRLGTNLTCPSDIWKVKTIKGDSSDNLPPGSPIEVIDLTTPPVQHRLWLDREKAPLLRTLLKSEPNQVDPDKTANALNYLRQLGMNPFIKPYNKDH